MKFEKFENIKTNECVLSGVHKSGLRVYIVPKKGFSKYYAIYGTDFGSCTREFKAEGDSEKTVLPDGIAHFLEHKLFEEEDGKNAFDRFSATGANANAYTSFDITAYLFSSTDSFYENLEILLDFVNHPYFTDENVAKEQGIIGQEIKMYDDDPGWRLFFNMLGAMFNENPVKIDIAGTVESISEITPELLYKCTDNFYNPSNMALVMVGGVDAEKAEALIDKYVTKEPINEIECFNPIEPEKIAKGYAEQKLSVSMPLFMIGFKEKKGFTGGEELQKREIITELILEMYFGQSSRLYTKLYDEGLINASYGKETELEKAYGFTAISGESQNPEKVYDEVKKYIEKITGEDVPDDAFERAKKVLIGKNLKSLNSVENIGNSFIKKLFKGQNPLLYNEVAEKITKEEIKERLSEHFAAENSVLSVINPADSER